MTRRPLWQATLTGWIFIGLVMVVSSWGKIRDFTFFDPDDTMRLLQVRDLLAGQSWWDVAQHRMVLGDLHWSRLVDLPVAATLFLFSTFLDQGLAERLTLVAVPLVTLAAVLGLAVGLTRRVAGTLPAYYAIVVVLLAVPLLGQVRPMRIDHHGWQVVFALGALFFLLEKATLRAGVAMGASTATLVIISLEGLPIGATLGGLAALAWAFQPARRGALLGFAWTLFAAAALLHLVTRGFSYAAPMCDAVTPQWIAVLGVAALTTSAATMVASASLPARLLGLGSAGAATAAALLYLAPECVGGPFAQLDPITRHVWYENVLEGMPVWRHESAWIVLSLGLPISGMVGMVLALRGSTGDARMRWALLLGATFVAFVLAVMVARAGATANAFAVPGAAWLLAELIKRARSVSAMVPRALATVGAFLVISPGLFVASLFPGPENQAKAPDSSRPTACNDDSDARALALLPASLLFAPLQIGPDIIAASKHRVISSGYHRNQAGIRDIAAAFTGDPVSARAIVHRYGARYVVACPGNGEMSLYASVAPNGFWAQLERGERFDWLEPVPIAGSPVLAWRVAK